MYVTLNHSYTVYLHYTFVVLLNSSDLLYVTCDPTGRPWKVWRHRIGEEEQNDTLLFQNDNEYSTLNVSLTRDSNYVTMTTSSRLASQVCTFIMCMYMYVYVRMYLRIYVFICVWIYMYIRTYTYIQCTYINIYTYIHT